MTVRTISKHSFFNFNFMINESVTSVKIDRLEGDNITNTDDLLAIEEPLEIRLAFGPKEKRELLNVSITMRTPGNDFELAVGFLFTEGIIFNKAQLNTSALFTNTNKTSSTTNIIHVELSESIEVDPAILKRNFYTTSACGVCGKTSIEAIFSTCKLTGASKDFFVPKEIILQLPNLLQKQQNLFNSTGGIHAAALFNIDGRLLQTREDVGRHNALDKLIGSYFLSSESDEIIPDESILLLSGRASFELLQKSAMAGIKIICAVGAPSSLAVETAKQFGITLIGFLRGNRFNIYSNSHRIII